MSGPSRVARQVPRVLWHGTKHEGLPKLKPYLGALWLAYSPHIAAEYAAAGGRGLTGDIWKVVLKNSARIPDLRDLRDPVTRELFTEWQIREKPITESAWKRLMASSKAWVHIEFSSFAFDWLKARVPGFAAGDYVGTSHEHDSVALFDMTAVRSMKRMPAEEAFRQGSTAGYLKRVADKHPHLRTSSKIVPLPAMYKKLVDWATPILAARAVTQLEKRKAEVLVMLNRAPEKRPRFVNEGALRDSLVSVEHGLKEAKKLAHGTRVKAKYEITLPLDTTGWVHEGRVRSYIEESPSYYAMSLDYRLVRELTVVIHNSRNPRHNAKGSYRGGVINLWFPTVFVRGSGRKGVHDYISLSLDTLRHEMVHYSQYVLDAVVNTRQRTKTIPQGKNKGKPLPHAKAVGVPSGGRLRQNRSDSYKRNIQNDGDAGVLDREHSLLDVEFYSRLSDEITEAKRKVSGVKRNMRKEYLSVWVGAKPDVSARFKLHHRYTYSSIEPAVFFVALKKSNRKKWQKAVSEFMSEVL